MTKASDVIALAKETRRVVETDLDNAELFKGLRETARNKGIDWPQLKALVKAQAQDARDDGHRVGKIVEKADFAAAYAEMLSGKMNEKHETRSSNQPPRTATEKPAQTSQPILDAGHVTINTAQSELREQLKASLALADKPADEYPDIPESLRRTRAEVS